MTEKFKVGDNVRIVKNTGSSDFSVFIGHVGKVLKVGNDDRCVIEGVQWTYDVAWYPSELQLIDEYPMDYTTAFKALIDGKMVEDSKGVILRFNKDAMRFQCQTMTGKFLNVDTVPTNEKFREYIAKPKFKQGQFVEHGDEYVRIAKILDNGNYVVAWHPSRYNEGTAFIEYKESELSEVQ